MAVDEALLEQAAQTGVPALRFYQWSEPTLSLGYFQKHGDRYAHAASLACAAVRRTTGGGAILHDRELTYSVVWPSASHRPSQRQDLTWLYTTVHTAMQEVLAQFGIRSELYHSAASPTPAESPFLCFQRRSIGDLLIDGNKVLGSAQRRHRAAGLQHGSLVLSSSSNAIEIRGIHELTGVEITPESVMEVWPLQIQSSLCLDLESGSLDDYESQRAEELVRSKFEHPAWTQRR
jgi:lipoate-protein ligase A